MPLGKAVPEVYNIEKSNKKTSSSSVASGVAIGNAMSKVGDAFIDMGKHVLDVTVDYSSAMGQLQASTGATTEDMEKYGDIIKSIYGNNYGESFTDIAEAIASVKKNLGELDDTDLQSITESAFALRDTFGYEIPESTRAAKAIIDNFGISGEQAMNLIANGAQNGLDYSGELLDSISEYSVQFAKVGLSADDMFNIFAKGAESGAFNLDKVGDAVKEFSIRALDGSDTTIEGFQKIGLNADEMAAKFAAGGDTARDAFIQTVEALASMEDPLQQNLAGVDLFGTMWEDLGPEVIEQLASIQNEAYGTADAMETIKDVKYGDLSSMIEELTRSFEMLMMPLAEAVIPLLTQLIDTVFPVLQAVIEPLIPILTQLIQPISDIITALTPLITLILDSLMPIITELGGIVATTFGAIAQTIGNAISTIMPILSGLMDFISTYVLSVITIAASTISNTIQNLMSYISDIISSIKRVISGIVDFIAGVFTGDWERAWNGVKDIFGGIVDGLATMFKFPINAIIGIINGFIRGLNKIKIPDWVPGVGGYGINIPEIPRLKAGIDYVPSDFWPAYLDKGEMVLTAEEAQAYRGNLMSHALDSTAYGGAGNKSAKITVPLYLDGREVARTTAWWTGEQLSWEEI